MNIKTKKILHRDIKPQNFLLCYDEETKEKIIKITDFGIAKEVDYFRKIKKSEYSMIGKK